MAQPDAELNELLDPSTADQVVPRSRFYLRVAAWCDTHDPIPKQVVALVRRLRDEDDDSPILDRLAAWVAPSVQGMLDLAGWAHGRRACFDYAWREAAARWKQGAEPTEAEQDMLKEIADPEESWEFEAFQRATARHGSVAFQACEEALRSPECGPVWRVILRTWLRGVRDSASSA